MRIIYLTLKDLSQILRDKRSLLFLVAMPLVFTLFMGFSLRGAAETPDTRIPIGWANDDGNDPVSKTLGGMLASDPGINLIPITSGDADELVRGGKITAAVLVPAGFGQAALDGKSPQVTLIADEATTTGQTIEQLVNLPVLRVMSAAQTGRISAEAVQKSNTLTSQEEQQIITEGFSMTAEKWQKVDENGITIKREKVEKNTGAETQPMNGNPYNQSSPGMIVMFAIFGLVSSGNILVVERKSHTLQRLLTTSMTSAEIIAGHLLANFVLVFVQALLLVVFGQCFLGVDYLRQPGATLLVTASLALWVASMGLFISVFARGEEQVILFSMAAMFIFAALGGAWFPLEGAGSAFSTIGHFTPAAWAMDGFQNILLRGLGTDSVLFPTGILALYALAFFVLAVWRFNATPNE